MWRWRAATRNEIADGELSCVPERVPPPPTEILASTTGKNRRASHLTCIACVNTRRDKRVLSQRRPRGARHRAHGNHQEEKPSLLRFLDNEDGCNEYWVKNLN
ncbi:hypothetical protein EYF80_028766 [Liparis tanakae]|uniref:Uncharacterized protein n=1 Tax=Liparis tanakae TaxID=230148 RepID=A0A4Z2H543_9TELE|nr:hypothetical protein EYF80_028766 [Liparis tanakae]